MTDYFTSFFSLFFSVENQLITMFLSAFLSATVLPGNSEIIFTTLATQTRLTDSNLFSSQILWLLGVATVGNSLGSSITYAMGLLIPKPLDLKHKTAQWALRLCEKYGVFALLLSSLPIIGDLLCGIAGWLRFNLWQSLIFICLGKFIRYLILLFAISPWF
ncbi:DedA family protein [Actinobacillus genomosp. 1]|uniref:YqaA family protein n=1 Tax=Actinobacillus genomosp. 1 TaxID=254839 RepID=UPI0024412E59|nr:DedA family protein [Actinobacillus genomosp. 1]WGE34202.1 DedA family protein [Actinobacillus genomosp. 1]WGE91591.1 DedA family protein [Actinobacillus genomosp. 1]